MRLHSEKPPCPRRGKPKAAEAMLSRSLAERGGKAECRAEESDRYPARCWGSRVASQPLLKAETIMRTLRTGKGRRRESWAGRTPGLHLHLHLRLPEQLLARTSMVPTTPVSPKQGRRPNDEGGCWPHTRCAGFRQPRCAAPAQQAIDQPDSAAFHPAGGQSLDQRSGLVSRAGPRLPVHTPGREKASQPPLRVQAGEREQTRWCARDQDEADGPVPGAGSTPIG